MYNENDLRMYKEILSDSMYQNNDVSQGKPKSSSGAKWRILMSNIWKEFRENKIGSGILKYMESPVEYKYVTKMNEILSRINHIYENAGNNNFDNEKIGLINLITNQLKVHSERTVDTKEGLELLSKLISRLPSRILISEDGIVDILHKIPCELHYPGYNFLGPNTNLNKRLDENDNPITKPINKLDQAAMEHDIFYRDNKNTKVRHEADKILQNKAVERVLAKDSSLNEKTAALATASVMKIKRKCECGLNNKYLFLNK